MPTPLSVAVARALRSPRWTTDEARLVLDAVAASGLTCADFARAHPVDYQRLQTWRRRLATTASAPPSAPALRFIEVPAPPAPATSTRYELQLATGEVLRVEGAVDADAVRTLLALLRTAPAC